MALLKLKLKLSKLSKVAKKKVNNTANSNRISRLCLATTHLDDGIWKARINISDKYEVPEYIEIPFTEESLSPVKRYIFSKKEKLTIIRSTTWQHEGFDPEEFDIFRNDLIIAGYIKLVNGVQQFVYNEFVGFNEKHIINPVNINTDKKLYHKGYGNNK